MIRPFGSIALVLIMATALSGCDKSGGGTSISIASENGAGGSIDGNSGAVKIDTPVFKGEFNLPKINLTAENFDINGVHLYPGSRIAAVDIKPEKNDDDGIVTVRFESPASVDTVRGWLKDQFDRKGTKVSVEGNSIHGEADDKPFRFDLAPKGNVAAGTVTIG